MRNLVSVVLFVALTAIVFLTACWALDLPVVSVDFEGNCVKVETKEGLGSCDSLPEKYDLVYVRGNSE
jgi:hypothetical protein